MGKKAQEEMDELEEENKEAYIRMGEIEVDEEDDN